MNAQPSWRRKDEQGDDLIDVWKRRPPHSDERLAVDIIEQLERDLGNAVPVAVLRQHWLTGIACDPDLPRHTDRTRATCYCSVWRSEPLPTVGDALQAWLAHLAAQNVTAPVIPQPQPVR